MAFDRPPSAFRNQLGGEEFPFESGRYILYVALACPWANGVQQVARLRGLVRPLGSPEGDFPMQLAVVHPTWQYTDPDADAAFLASQQGEPTRGMSAGIGAAECHAGWVFCEPNEPVLPLAVMKQAKEAVGEDLPGTAEEICSGRADLARSPATREVLDRYGARSAHTTPDPSKHKAKTLRHLYEKCGGFMRNGVRATTPVIYDTKTDRIVSNESMDIAKYFNEWGEILSRSVASAGGAAEGTSEKRSRIAGCGPDLYPEELRPQIDEMIQWIYPINNGVYRCGFACSQPAYEQAAADLEARMLEVDAHLARDGLGARRSFLVGDRITIADVRLFNTLIRMDEVYVAYFKTYFASLFAPFGEEQSRFPNLLRFTAEMYARFAEVRECVVMDDIRNHYFTSHAIRNMFAVVPREVGVLRALDKIAIAQAKSGEQKDDTQDSTCSSPVSA